MSRAITVGGFRLARRRPSARRVPQLESLEDRRLLATFNPLPTAADGTAGSLRAAIIAADTNGQDNTIDLQAGTYQLAIGNPAGQENSAAQGDLDLAGAGHTITIQGAGAGKLETGFAILSDILAVHRC